MTLIGQMKKYNLQESYWNMPEPILPSEIRKQMNGKFPNIPKIFEYAKQQGKDVSDLTDEEKRMFLE